MSLIFEKKALLDKILGGEMVVPASNDSHHFGEDVLHIISGDLHSGIANYFNSSAPFFQARLPLDRIVRYKDGSFSSMERSIKGGFGQHQGYDIINGMDVAHQLMSHIMPILNQRLVSIYADLIKQNSDYLNQIHDIFIVPEISKLKSIAEYIRDVSDEIEQISKSTNLSIATLTNVQQRRIDLKQLFYTFISRLQQAVGAALFDPANIANSYLIARFALSNYIASLVLECIVAGNIDDVSIAKMKVKVEGCLQELNEITGRLSLILKQKKFSNANEINNINSFYRWSYDYLAQNQLNNLHFQNRNIDFIQTETLQYFDVAFEIKRLDDFIKARHEVLEKIEITGL